MQKAILIILTLIFISSAEKTKMVSDTITTDTTLSDTIEVLDGMVITNNAQVLVEPGTVFLFHNKSLLVNKGSIMVNGTKEDSVYFGPAEGKEWNGIELAGSNNVSTFSYTIIEKSSYQGLLILDSVNSTIRNSSIRDNKKGVHVGSSKLQIDTTSLTGSTEASGIWALFSSLTLNGVEVSENRGGIIVSSCTLNVDNNSSISSNFSEDDFGAGIQSYFSYVKINNSEITGNTSYNEWGGAGLYVTGDSGYFKMDNVIVSNNRAGKAGQKSRGGGMTIFGVEAELNDIYFYGNSASSEGGAIAFYSTDTGSLKINRCFFINNSVTNETGAIGADISIASSRPVQVSNSLFQNSTGAHALRLWKLSILKDLFYLVHNTFIGCEGLVSLDSLSSANWINNMAYNTSGEPFSIPEDTDLTIVTSNLSSEMSDLMPITGKPYFQISESSPCIDKASSIDNVHIGDKDLAGMPRISGSAGDIGAYEFQHDMAIIPKTTSSTTQNLTLLMGNRIGLTGTMGENTTIKVTTVSGKTVFEKNLKAGVKEIVLPSSIAPGIYLVTLRSSKGMETLPIMIR